jgi:hypothetical protein
MPHIEALMPYAVAFGFKAVMLEIPLFQDRVQAGQVLARSLRSLVFDIDTTLVLALPRGGVPVACRHARRAVDFLRAFLQACNPARARRVEEGRGT